MPGPIRLATSSDTAPLAISLARAFADDPVWQFLLPHEPSRQQRATRMFETLLKVHHLAHQSCYTDTDRAGGALWDPPGHWKMTLSQVARSAPKMLRSIGTAIPRALRVMTTVERQHPRTAHWYLAVLGTDPVHQHKGIGSALMTPVLERCDREGIGAYLESSKHANIPFYRRHGFEVTGEISLPGGPSVWPMWRDPRPSTAS